MSLGIEGAFHHGESVAEIDGIPNFRSLIGIASLENDISRLFLIGSERLIEIRIRYRLLFLDQSFLVRRVLAIEHARRLVLDSVHHVGVHHRRPHWNLRGHRVW